MRLRNGRSCPRPPPPQLEEEEPELPRGGLGMSESSSCPTGQETPAPGCRLGALYWGCVRNDPVQLQATLDGGVSPEEATQVDGNGRVSYLRCFPVQLEQPYVLATGHLSSAWIRGRKGGIEGRFKQRLNRWMWV